MPFPQSALAPYVNCPNCIGGTGGGSTVVALNDLTDVTITAPLNAGTVLRYNGTEWVNAGLVFDDLLDGDTTTVAPTVGQGVIWDGTNFVPGPVGGSNPTIHLTDTAVAPATAGEPTLAEIAAAAGVNTDLFVYYTGTDTATDPATYAYYVDSTGAVLLVDDPNVATCALREVGGAGGVLVVGDGAGVPNPVQTGYTMSADRMVGTVTTPPSGGSTTFEVRLMPGSTVITTGTIADGATAATFTAYPDTVMAAGQWIETVVTAVAPTPGSELTVAAEFCGPGTPTTVTAGGADVDAYTHTQAVASTQWTVGHGLNRPVAVRVEDGTGQDVDYDDVTYLDPNTLTIDFVAPISGTAYIT